MLVVVLDGELKPVGTLGGVVSVGGGVVLSTVMVTVPAWVVLPAPSLAIAVRLWLPLPRVVVSRLVEYGLVVSSAPSLLELGLPA
jgi:hypothetical protein